MMIRRFCGKLAGPSFQNPHGRFSNWCGDFLNPLGGFSSSSVGSPLLLAVNSSYFAMFSLIACILDVFLDANCSS
jgi:hypothetical protein